MAIENYTFEMNQFNKDGIHLLNGKLFTDYINLFEKDYVKKHPHIYPNVLTCNDTTAKFILCSFSVEDYYIGLDEDYDYQTNMKIMGHSSTPTIVAISSFIREDEKVFIQIDSSMYNNELTLSYKPDFGDNETIPEPLAPEEKINNPKIKSVLIV